jgi:hypothetical protein
MSFRGVSTLLPYLESKALWKHCSTFESLLSAILTLKSSMENDDFNRIPSNISTVVDLLDTKGISWGEYQEDMPYAGYQGFNFTNQQNTSRNDYVRKHNPLIIYDSVTSNATRLSLIKNFTSFASDLEAKTLPQWSFMTPNMTNDGHDTTITFTANWARTFLTPLLNNSYFMNNTLVVLTFDEDDTYTEHNSVYVSRRCMIVSERLFLEVVSELSRHLLICSPSTDRTSRWGYSRTRKYDRQHLLQSLQHALYSGAELGSPIFGTLGL